MGCRLGFDRRVGLALLAGLALAGGDAAAAGGKARANPAPAAGREEVLPAGCAHLVDGHGPVPSPDGKRVAFGRGGTPPLADVAGNVRPPDLWMRDVASGKEWPLPCASAPVAWTPDGILLLEAGYGVEAIKGARLARAAALPAGAAAIEVAWTRDGKRLAWVPRAPAGATTAVQVVGTDGKPRALGGTEGLLPAQAAFLAWSPDGASLFVDALYRIGSEVPVRKVGVVDVPTGEQRVLATMPDWIGIPGLRAGDPYYDDPRKARSAEAKDEGEAEGPQDGNGAGSGAGNADGKEAAKEDGKTKGIEWRFPTGPRWRRDVWSADSRLVTWLAGEAWTEADAFVADRATGETWRVTIDGDPKWSPAMDPSGRRLAFLTAAELGRRARSQSRKVRVLDLWTGESTDLPLAAVDGIPGSLSWMPGAYGVAYDVRDGPTARAYVQSVPAAKSPPASRGIVRLEYTPAKRIVAWLGSKDEDRVRLALRRADDAWDEAFVPAIREALLRWKDADSVVASVLVDLVERRQVRDAVPELRALLEAKRPSVQVDAAGVLLAFGEADAIELLDGLRTKAKDASARLGAAAALVRAGDDRGWPDLQQATESGDVMLRLRVVWELGNVRQPKSVDLLIPLVGDVKQPTDLPVRLPPALLVGKAAQGALLYLTGKSLGDDPAAWRTWWTDEAKRILPDPSEIPDLPERPARPEGPPALGQDGGE